MDVISFSEAATANSRIENFIENPDSTSGIVTVPKVIASGETVTIPAGRIAVLPNIQVDGELNIEGEVFVPSGSTLDFSNGIKVNGENIVMSVPTAYHIYNGGVSIDNKATSTELTTTTTKAYTTTDFIFCYSDNKLYDCILNASTGALLTNTTYFTPISWGNITINALVPYANGIDVNGSKVSISYKNETISGLTLTQGKNYLYSKNDGTYGSSVVDKAMVTSFSTVTSGATLKGDEFHLNQNKWQVVTNTPRGDLDNPSLVNVFGDGSCKALYRFEGNANDESSAYNGTATNVTYSTGVIGQCAVFNGSNSYVSTSTVPDIDSTTTGTYSVSMWMTLNSPASTVPIDIRQKFEVLFTASGINFINVPVSGSSGYNTLVSYTSSNKLVNVVIVKPAGSNYLNIYFDGVLQNGTNSTSGSYTHNTSFNIGRETNARYYYSGQIDQVRLFNKALSDVEAKSLYDLYSYSYSQSSPRTYLDCIVYADHNGQVEYVEELPKTTYVTDLKVTDSFDLGQTWQDMTSKRASGVTYTNSTGKPIMIILVLSADYPSVYVNGLQITQVSSGVRNAVFIVPNTQTYKVTFGTGSIVSWSELR